MRQFGTSVFNKVVRWRRWGEVENVYVAYNLSHFAIYLPNFIEICGNLTEVLTKQKYTVFETGCSSNRSINP